MLKENLYIKLRGKVNFILEDSLGNKTELHNNTIDAAVATQVIKKLLSGDATRKLDQIAAYKLGVLLSSKDIETYEFGVNTITCKVLFEFEDFNDTLDEVRLYNSLEGIFSSITGLSIEKTNLQKLGINWEIEITVT